jgi:formate dehydrogenase major subunit
MKPTIGEGAATNPFDDIYEAEFLLVIGSNTTEAHPIVANRILKAHQNGVGLAVVDVREIQLSKKANYHLSIPPESNLLFLNMMSFVIITEKLYNEEFIKNRTVDFEYFAEQILRDPYANPDFFKSIKGYESLAIMTKEIARTYAKSRSMILWGLGITEHIDGTRAVSAIANLAMMTGNIGKIGAGLMPLRGQNNVQGACDVGCLPYYAPDYQKPDIEGLKTPDIMDAILDQKIKAVINMGEDLTHIHPNLNKVTKAVGSLEFLATLEVVEASMTNKADIVFAVKSAYEKRGVYVNAERRAHLSKPIIDSSLPDDWEVIQMIAKELGSNYYYSDVDELWDETRSVVKRFAGASREKLEQNNDGLQWPIEENETPRLHLDRFRTSDGLGHFKYYPYKLRGFVKALKEQKQPKMTLTTGRVIAQYNNASQTKLSPKLLSSCSEDIVLISHEDAKKYDLRQPAILVSKYGQSRPLKLKESKTIKKGTLYASYHFESSHINYLFGDESDSLTKTPRFKAVEVEIKQGGLFGIDDFESTDWLQKTATQPPL